MLACADGRENKAVTAQLRTIAHNVAGRIWRKFDLKPHLIGIRKWIEHWNDNPGPFASTKTAEEIPNSLAEYQSKISGERTSGLRPQSSTKSR